MIGIAWQGLEQFSNFFFYIFNIRLLILSFKQKIRDQFFVFLFIFCQPHANSKQAVCIEGLQLFFYFVYRRSNHPAYVLSMLNLQSIVSNGEGTRQAAYVPKFRNIAEMPVTIKISSMNT